MRLVTMIAALAIAIALLLGPLATQAQVANWRRCGGINHCGRNAACESCSNPNFECVSRNNNRYYWQCRPRSEANSNSGNGAVVNSKPVTVTLPPPQAPAGGGSQATWPAVANYGACGGTSNHDCKDNAACAACLPGSDGTPYSCQRGNEYYWQCKPGISSSPSTPAPSPAAPTPSVPPFTPPESSEGLAKTTRFFDGCKPTCAWPTNVKKPLHMGPVSTCTNEFLPNGTQPHNTDPNVKSVCAGGGTGPGAAYTCLDRAPFTENGQMFAFAASNSPCCECFELTFLDTAVDGNGQKCRGCSSYNGELAGETLIVQVVNSGADLGGKHFDLMIPGGGMGIFNGLAGTGAQNGPPLFPNSTYEAWGQRYGGVSTKSECYGLPVPAQAGCLWRFEDFKGADNPGVSFRRVSCSSYPTLYEKSGCFLEEDRL